MIHALQPGLHSVVNFARRVGFPARGGKRDLVSALQHFLKNKVDDENGQLAKEEGPMMKKSGRTKSKSSENKSEISNDQVVAPCNTTAPVSSGRQRSNKGAKNLPVIDKVSRGRTKIVKAQQLSSQTDEASGKKVRQAKRKASFESRIETFEAGNQIDQSMSQVEPWTVLTHKKPQPGWMPYNPKIMRPPSPSDGMKFVKLMSWNVNGLRALLKLEGFSAFQLAQRENFDVLCLQETKLQDKDVVAMKQTLIDGYDNCFWTCSASKLGYSGTAIISRIKPLSVSYGLGIPDHDGEGRIVTAEFDSFYLISGYVPNSGDGLKRLPYRITEWDTSLGNYVKELEKSKPVILTGDLNCAHQEIDIYNPAGNKRSAGFTKEERDSFEKNFLSRGLVDTFRRQHPDVVGYTYWGYRHGGRKTNKGWRLDYFLVSESIADKVYDSYILPDVAGSDHSPIGLILKL